MLVADHRETACRAIRTLHDNGIRSIMVYSDADADAPHARMTGMVTHIGPSPARESCPVIDKIIGAARRYDASGIHPGYGFLSENANFATACEEADIELIGPPASAINAMDDKISVRVAVEARDAPTVPGLSRPGFSNEDLIGAAPSIGFPVLIKPSAGGSGKGMHRVENAADLPAALATARHEAAGVFGDDSPSIEHFVDTPRHIEVQILVSKHGNVTHLGERECSLQRRYQKVIEEAPSPLLDEETCNATGEAVCGAACSVGYVSVDVVEFIVPAKDLPSFFSMEINARLQVEHPVTEQTTGLDLVTPRIDAASGRPLSVTRKDITLAGHSIETRAYAEDPVAGFLPTGSTVTCVVKPSRAGIRVDFGITDDSEVSSLYDSMLTKVISHGENREQALERPDKALGDAVIVGIGVNIDSCRYLLNVPEVHAGDPDTDLPDRVAEGLTTSGTPDDIYLAATMDWLTSHFEEATDSLWLTPDSWHANTPAAQRIRLGTGEDSCLISIVGTPSSADVIVGDMIMDLSAETEDEEIDVPRPRNYEASVYRDGEHLRITRDGVTRHFPVETIGHTETVNHEEYVVAGAHGTWVLLHTEVVTTGAEADIGGSGVVQAPVPGTITALSVEEGARVEVGDAPLVMEAIKMEHTLIIEIVGEVSFTIVPDGQVTGDQQLAVITAVEDQQTT